MDDMLYGLGFSMSQTYSNSANAQVTNFSYANIKQAMEKLNDVPRPNNIIIIPDHFLVDVVIPSPRKKKNRRWNKKYQKRHTYTKPSTNYYYVASMQAIICHPAILEEVERIFSILPTQR